VTLQQIETAEQLLELVAAYYEAHKEEIQ